MGALEDSVKAGVQEALCNTPTQPFAPEVMELIEEAGLECLALVYGTPPDPQAMLASALGHLQEAVRLAFLA